MPSTAAFDKYERVPVGFTLTSFIPSCRRSDKLPVSAWNPFSLEPAKISIGASEEFVIFNPKLEVIDEQKQGFWEGCLSVPGLRGYVERPRKLKIKYLYENADEKEVVVEDFLATVFQHELDHLFGFLYVDRLSSTKDLVFEEELTNIASEKLLD